MGFSQEEYWSGVPFPTTGDLADPGILKELEISDHLTYLLRNLYAGHKATIKTGHGTTDWFQIGEGVHQVGDAIQTSHPLLSPSPSAFSLSQYQGPFQRVSFSHQVAKVLELQYQSLW